MSGEPPLPRVILIEVDPDDPGETSPTSDNPPPSEALLQRLVTAETLEASKLSVNTTAGSEAMPSSRRYLPAMPAGHSPIGASAVPVPASPSMLVDSPHAISVSTGHAQCVALISTSYATPRRHEITRRARIRANRARRV